MTGAPITAQTRMIGALLFLSKRRDITMVSYKRKKRNKKDRTGKPYTEEEIKRLMGVYGPTYKRVKGGAFKQK